MAAKPKVLLEPLQQIEKLPAFKAAAKRLKLKPDARFALALDFQACGVEIINALAGEFIQRIDTGAMDLARQHQDPETLETIRKIQAAVYAVYVKTGSTA